MNKNMLNRKSTNAFWFFGAAVLVALLLMAAVSAILIKMQRANKPESVPTVANPESILSITNNSGTSSASVKDLPQVSIRIDQIGTFADHYSIRGALIQDDISLGDLNWADISTVSTMVLTDSTGAQIPIEPINVSSTTENLFWFNTQGKGAAGDLTLTLPSAQFHFDHIPSRIFEIDFGEYPQENQKWSLNEDFDLAGKNVHLSSVTARTIYSRPALEFIMTGDSDVIGALIFDTSVQAFTGDDFFTLFQNGQIVTQFKYAGNAFPTGKRQFTFSRVSFSAQGNWQTTFDPALIDK